LLRLVLVLLSALPGTAAGEWNAWSAGGGPYGGRIHALAAAPAGSRRIYAGTERGGVFRSLGDGAGWTARNEGLSLTDILCITVHPFRSDTLFAGTGGAGVYRSTNGGDSWYEADAGIVGSFINDIVYSGDGARVFAGTSSGGVYVSENHGATWTPSNDGLTNPSVRALAFAPSNPALLFAGTSNGIFRSTDGGSTWTRKSDGLVHTIIGDIAVDPIDPNVVYAGTLGGGVYKSIDGGDQWSQSASSMATAYVRGIWIHSDRPDTIWAATNRGVFETFDGASTWFSRDAGREDTTAQAILRTGDSLYAGGYWGGVDVTATPEAGWTPRNDLLSNRFVWELALSEEDPNAVWAASFGGLSHSSDRGETWVDSNPVSDTFDFRTVDLRPGSENELLAGAFYGGIFRSIDGGASWASSSSGLGATGTVTAVRYKPDDGSVVLSATYGGTYKSTNGGASWASSYSGMGAKKVWGIDVAPSAPSLVYAGTYGSGLYRSRDFGATWTAVPLGETYIRAVAIDPSDTAVVYAGGYYLQSGLGGVYKSTDGGATWASKNAGLGNRTIWSIAVDPLDTRHLLAATVDGIYESPNGGDSWIDHSGGLVPRDIRWVAFSGERALAGSYGGSVPWYQSISTGVLAGGAPEPAAISLLAFPNPFNASTTVRAGFGDGEGGGPLRIAVYDIAGRLVRVLASVDLARGEALFVGWDGRNELGHEVASGVYLALATSAKGKKTERLVIVR
jgi:photosystem II stability/assembly factor-like uncharacterized protein